MKKTNISSLKRDLSRYIDYVRKGGTVRVYDRQTPVAEIVPLQDRPEVSDETMQTIIDRLEREGSVIRGSGRFPDEVLRRRPIKTRRSVVETVLEERREGR